MKKLLLLISIKFLCLSSAANTLSDCIADALDRLLSQDLAYATHVYVECDNLPLDLLTRENKKFKYISNYRFLYASGHMYIDAKKDAREAGQKTSRKRCHIKYELNKDIITITITPYDLEYKKGRYFNGLLDWYTYNYRYDFGTGQWIFESKSSGGI